MAKQEVRVARFGEAGAAKFRATPESVALEFSDRSTPEPQMKVEWRGEFPILRSDLRDLVEGRGGSLEGSDLAAIITAGTSELEVRSDSLKLNGADARLDDSDVQEIVRQLHQRWAGMTGAADDSATSAQRSQTTEYESYSDETTEEGSGSGVVDAVCAVVGVAAGISAATLNPVGAAIWGPPALGCAIYAIRTKGGGGSKKDAGGKPPLDQVLEP